MSWKELLSMRFVLGDDSDGAVNTAKGQAVKVSMRESLPGMDDGAFKAAGRSDAVEFGRTVLREPLMQGEFVEVAMDGLHYMPPGVFFERAIGSVVADGRISPNVVRDRLSFTRAGEPDRVANAIAFKAASAAANAAKAAS